MSRASDKAGSKPRLRRKGEPYGVAARRHVREAEARVNEAKAAKKP